MPKTPKSPPTTGQPPSQPPGDHAPTEGAAKGKRSTDWERIESLYRAGTLSVREIAEEVGTSHTAINKRVKQAGWTRDLRAKVQARADALVSKAMVSSEVSATALATETLVVEVEAQVQSRIRLAHRAGIARYRALGEKLLSELEAQSEQVPELMALGLAMRTESEAGVDKLNDLYQKIISLPTRTKTLKDAAETLKVLIGLEREAFGLDDPAEKPKPKPPAPEDVTPEAAVESYRSWVGG